MDLDDRALGHPLSVDTILPVDENVLLTGSFDGLIRVLEVQVRWAVWHRGHGWRRMWQGLCDDSRCGCVCLRLCRYAAVQPTKLHGVVGEHGEFPIERIQYSRDKKFLASCSHDKLVKFWDIAFLFEEDDDEAGGDDGDGASLLLTLPLVVSSIHSCTVVAVCGPGYCCCRSDVGMADDDDAGAGAGAGAGSGAGAGGAAAAGAGAGAGAAAPRKSLKQPGNAESFFDDL